MTPEDQKGVPGGRIIGAYVMHEPFAGGGMATVHFGAAHGAEGFSRIVAIKRLREDVADAASSRLRLADEARTSVRVRHPNVVSTLDVVLADGELFLVMDYVHGESLACLLAAQRATGERAPVGVVVAILQGALYGLQAAHEAKDANGEPLDIVHRDLSPQNILVDNSGNARVADFGVARARGRLLRSSVDTLKGKIGYMAPEQIHDDATQRSDIFAMGVVTWEALTGERLFTGRSSAEILSAALLAKVSSPRALNPAVPEAVERAVLRSLSRRPTDRFATALEFAHSLQIAEVAGRDEVAKWVGALVGDRLAARESRLRALEHVAATSTEGAGIRRARATPSARAGTRRVVAAGVVVTGAVALSLATRPAARPAAVTGSPAVAEVAPPESVASLPGPEVPSAAPPEASQPASTPVRRTVVRPPPLEDCSPPFTIDERGHRIFKVQCFDRRPSSSKLQR